MAEEKLQRSHKVPESAGKKATCWSWEICWDNRFIIQQVLMLCLPCNVARELSISMCEILSSALSPTCTVTGDKVQASVQSVLPVLVVPGFLLEQLLWTHAARVPLAVQTLAHPLGEGSASVNSSVLASVCSYRVLSISRRNRNNDQGIEAFLS